MLTPLPETLCRETSLDAVASRILADSDSVLNQVVDTSSLEALSLLPSSRTPRRHRLNEPHYRPLDTTYRGTQVQGRDDTNITKQQQQQRRRRRRRWWTTTVGHDDARPCATTGVAPSLESTVHRRNTQTRNRLIITERAIVHAHTPIIPNSVSPKRSRQRVSLSLLLCVKRRLCSNRLLLAVCAAARSSGWHEATERKAKRPEAALTGTTGRRCRGPAFNAVTAPTD